MGPRSEVKIKWWYRTPKAPVIVNHLERKVANDHPLKPFGVPIIDKRTMNLPLKENKEKDVKSVLYDPLSMTCEVSDPLSLMAAEMEWDPVETPTPVKEQATEFSFGLKPWAEQRTTILNKFTTSQKLSMTSSFLGGEKTSTSHHNPIVQHRLEQLDYFEEGTLKEVTQMTQQQYTESINRLSEELVQAWNQNLRVKSLKITIQCSKLLADTSVLQFYPSKFFLITDILDIFGSLVYERLKSKSDGQPSRSKEDSSVSESAMETCRNWFYKIASIRELVPRLYVEAAILKSYSFLTNKEFAESLGRLTTMVRGIGDPLVAIYARCYLCHVGMSVSTINRTFLKDNFYDFLAVYHQIYSPYTRQELDKQKVDLSTYLEVHSPAIDWILHGLSHKAPDSLLDEIVERCAKIKNNGLLLNSIMTNFKPNYIAMKADRFIQLVSSVSQGVPQYLLFQTLGQCLQNHLVENPQNVLDKAWKLIQKLNVTEHFMTCARAWTVFIVKNFSHDNINKFLGDIITQVGSEGKKYTQILQSIVTTIVINISDIEQMFMMDKLLPLLDLFESEYDKVFVCRKILQVLASKQGFTSTDPVTNDALLFITKILHDSVNSLTVDDEKKQIGALISTTIKQIKFGKDFERQLDFYVEARATFTNIDTVLSTLVYCVNNLAMETGRIVKSNHTRKTGPFVHACAAYCFITIPSIESIIVKLQLYLLSSQVALFNQCLGQASACIKAALSLILDLPLTIECGLKEKSTEPFLAEYICNMLSTLIVVPDNANQGVMYLTRGLINTLNHCNNDQRTGTVASLFLNVLDMLAMSAQPKYTYHVKRIDSNDVFYGSDPKFITELNKMGSVVQDELFNHLKLLGSNNHINKQAKMSFDLFIRVVLHTDMDNPEMTALALNLWNLAHRHGSLDSKFASNTVEYLKGRTLFSSSMVQKEL